MNVFIFDRLCKDSVTLVQGYLNVKTPDQSISVRHYYAQLPDGEILDPTFFTEQMIANELSNTREPVHDHVQEEEARDFFFHQMQSTDEAYWLLTHKKCVDVYKGVLKDLGLRFEDYPIPVRKLAVNDVCPCGSGKKYKRCHATTGPIV